MAATKTAKTLLASQSLAANASVNTNEWDLRTAYGGMAAVKLSLPGSAPSTAPVVKFYIGESSGKKCLLYQASGSASAADYPMDIQCEIPPSAMFANITIINGATNAVTVESAAQELTTI